MSSTQIDTKRKRKKNSKRSELSGLKIFVCSTIIMSCMIVLCLLVLMPDAIKFAKPYAVAIEAFLILVYTICFIIFDE